jgi:hypothetical protein
VLAIALTEHGAPEVVEAQLAFHRAAGVDLVLVPDGHPGNGAVHATAVPVEGADWDAAAAAHGATWIFEAGAGEFWWPRGGSLADLVHALPASVDAIAGLERRFAPPPPGRGSLFERATLRLAPHVPATASAVPVARPRRVVRRLGTLSSASPIRGWFPVEVLCFPPDGIDGAPGSEVELIEDTRVRDALRLLAAGETPVFRRGDVLSDPSFGVEVATLFEEELLATNALLAALEAHVARLERNGLRNRAGRLANRARRGQRG